MTTTKALAKLYYAITGEQGKNSAAKILSDLADHWSQAVPAASFSQGAAVADAASTAPTAAEFKALLDSLREAGIIATSDS